MRTILLNDTRSNGHVGCDLVIENTLAECSRVGLNVIATVPNSASDDASIVQRRVDDFDLLLVNGEGSMHDDRPKALEMARAAEVAKKQGKRVVLFNTVWQHNQKLNEFLSAFDQIYCRESYSQQAIQQVGAAATVVPDMTFATVVDPRGDRGENIAVLDSYDRRTTLRLAWRSAIHGYHYMPMDVRHFHKVNKRKLSTMLLRLRSADHFCTPADRFLERLAQRQAVLTPRFHGLCLLLLLERPFVSVASNTFKTEGMFSDIGIDVGLIAPLTDTMRYLNRRRLLARAGESTQYLPQIRQYKSEARQRIRGMFEAIVDARRAVA